MFHLISITLKISHADSNDPNFIWLGWGIDSEGIEFLGSGTPTFWLGLLLFIKRESWTPTFKILVRTLCYQYEELPYVK